MSYTSPTPEESALDEVLMQEVRDRKSDALHQLYRRYHGLVQTVAMSVVHNPADAEEVLQDVFLHLWNRSEAYSAQRGKPLGWLIMLARRRAIDRLRQQASYRRATDRLELEVQHQEQAADPREANRKACLDDLRSILRQQMHRLPPAQREALELTFFKGMSQREIAAAADLPLGTVKTRIELGLRKLGHMLVTARLKIA